MSDTDTLPVRAPDEIDAFLDALWLEDGLSRNTLAAYRSDLALFVRWLAQQTPPRSLLQALEMDIQLYQGYLFSSGGVQGRGGKATSANRKLTVLKRFYRWAVREQRLA